MISFGRWRPFSRQLSILSMLALLTMLAFEENLLATLTIRNLDDTLKNRLRVRAASRNQSVSAMFNEDFAQRILPFGSAAAVATRRLPRTSVRTVETPHQ